jgi:hypothetical protein
MYFSSTAHIRSLVAAELKRPRHLDPTWVALKVCPNLRAPYRVGWGLCSDSIIASKLPEKHKMKQWYSI